MRNVVTSLCPVLVNQYIGATFASPSPVPGDLDLCRWSAVSPYGNYAAVKPTQTITYSSCSAWEADRARWFAAGKPIDSPPGLVGHMVSRFTFVVTPIEKDPQTEGNFIVRIGFDPADPPNESEIFVTRPTWPGMSALQQQAIDEAVALILTHELGHQNLAGHTAKAHESSVSVPAKNMQDAANIVMTDPIWASAALQRMVSSGSQVGIVYDNLTADGVTQSALGGTDPPNLRCNPPTLLETALSAGTSTEVFCFGEFYEGQRYIIIRGSGEYSTYSPPPSTFLHSDTIRTRFHFVNRGDCGGLPTTITTTDEPGSAPLAGELRTVSSSNSQNNTWTNPNTGRSVSESQTASASASGLYDDADGVLTLTATLTCSMDASASWTRGLNQGWPDAVTYGFAKFRFTVSADSTFTLSATGEWMGDGFAPQQYPSVSLVNVAGPATVSIPLPAPELASGVSMTLGAGTYELQIFQNCPETFLNPDTATSNSTSVNLSASVTEGVL